jgi:hypothetical protein
MKLRLPVNLNVQFPMRYCPIMHRFLTALMLLILGFCPPATAWNVSVERDRLSDKAMTWAEVRNGNARLLVGCLNGKVQPRLMWDRRIGWGDVGVSYRFDDGPVVPRMAMVSQDGVTLYPWLGDPAGAMARLAKAKRLRVQLGQAFYDFDLTQGERLPARWGGC